MSGQGVLLAGATGLVGGLVLRELLADPGFRGRIVAPVRRPLGLNDVRLVTVTPDLSISGGEVEIDSALGGSSVLSSYVCCLGTTIKAAGSREAFIAVDRELVLRLAKVAKAHGARQAILVSSAGASRQSANFYLRVKGEVEDALSALGFDRVDILRPGLLLGERRERRTGEAIAQVLAPLGNLLLHGRLSRYRAVEAQDVAVAIASLVGEQEPGSFVHEHASIRVLATH
jgi:uncharacterized protein YbjT (DUF2867 family)